MAMSPPLVSVIIPTYYRKESLRQSIESALDQEYDNLEVIVVDDSGERYAESTVQKYINVDSNVKYVFHDDNQGGNPARNTGINLADGKYIQLLDDDDIIYPGKIERQVNLLEEKPNAGVAYGGIENRNGREIYPIDYNGPSLHQALQFKWPTTITSSLLISGPLLRDILPLKNRRAADDVGMKIELAHRTEFEYVDEILTSIGQSDDNRSMSMDFLYELQSIYNEYGDIYEECPNSVRRNALGTIYEVRGNRLIIDYKLPLLATPSYLQVIRYRRDLTFHQIAILLVSLFGKPGWILGRWIKHRYILD